MKHAWKWILGILALIVGYEIYENMKNGSQSVGGGSNGGQMSQAETEQSSSTQSSVVPNASLVITKATYGYPGGSSGIFTNKPAFVSAGVIDVTNIVQGWVENGSIKGVNAQQQPDYFNAQFGGDPAVNDSKTLTIDYTLSGIPYSWVGGENAVVNIN